VKKLRPIIVLALCLTTAWPAHGRDDKYLLPIQAALEAKNVIGRPDGSVKFFFSKQPTPSIIAQLGSDTTHGRTAKLRNSDQVICEAAFLAALLALQKRAKQVGANAVVNIVSYYQQVEMSSTSEYECHAGTAAHVYLKGEFAKIADQ
jgi:uncharacterized protein YbjQ (UPF0145 family)